MSELLSVMDLKVTFAVDPPVQAVRGVSFSLARGECLGIVGESGSGKSVTAWAATGLLGPDAKVKGTVEIDSREVKSFSNEEKRRLRGTKVAMIFQEPSRSFDPIMNLESTFLETFRAHKPKAEKDVCQAKAAALLREVHIPEPEKRLKSFPHQFSGGMLQRVMIALSLANNPELLVCDEPTTALDVTIQAQIIALLGELKVRRGLSLIFISHDLDLVARIADRVLVMYGGIVLEEGPTADIMANPMSPYTRALWNSRVSWGSHYDRDPLKLIGGMPPDPTHPEPGCPFAPRCRSAKSVCAEALPEETRPREDRMYRCLFPGAADE